MSQNVRPAFILYARVSTEKQGIGLDAQQEAAAHYVSSIGGDIIATYSEKKSGRKADRPQLAAAIAQCKKQGARLIVAKLDRLSRDVAFLFTLRDSLTAAGVDIVCADCPDLISDTLRLGIYATLAQKERELISERTKAALAIRREQGIIGGRSKGADTSKASAAAARAHKDDADAWAAKVRPLIMLCREKGATLQEIANTLNDSGTSTRRGGTWTATAVRRILNRAI